MGVTIRGGDGSAEHHAGGPASRHGSDALVYGSDDELVEVAVPFLRAGLDGGEAVALFCAEPRATLLAGAVGELPRLTVLSPPRGWRRPIEALQDDQRQIEEGVAAGRRVRIVADSDFGPGPVDWSEWARFEAVAHHAARAYPVSRLCLLDRRQAPPEVLAATGRLHPTRYEHGVRVPSRTYVEPAENVRRDAYVGHDPMTDLPPTIRAEELTAADLAVLRHSVTAELDRRGVPPWRVHEFIVAVSEIVANALRHGRPPVRARLWSTARRVLCTVTDTGAGFDYPLSGYLPVVQGRAGLGLYLSRQLADQVNICWTPDGFTVRLALVLP